LLGGIKRSESTSGIVNVDMLLGERKRIDSIQLLSKSAKQLSSALVVPQEISELLKTKYELLRKLKV